MDEIFGKHGLPQAVRCDKDNVLAFGEEIERQNAFDRGPMNLFRPLPLEVDQHLEPAETRVSQPALDSLPRSRLTFGLDELLEQHGRAPAFLRCPHDEIIQLAGGMEQPELSQLITRGRGNQFG
jgi:hypothetical protein